MIVPAMGSHGGATRAEGQREVLAAYGVTEREVGAPIDASMDVTEVGDRRARREGGRRRRVPRGRRRHRREPREAAHRFRQRGVGSGLLKMSVIGLGKAEGAFRAHWAAKTQGYEQVFLDVSACVTARTLPNGVGVRAGARTARTNSDASTLLRRRSSRPGTELLQRARSWMPALPIPEVDVLIVDEIGKNISGAGWTPTSSAAAWT